MCELNVFTGLVGVWNLMRSDLNGVDGVGLIMIDRCVANSPFGVLVSQLSGLATSDSVIIHIW